MTAKNRNPNKAKTIFPKCEIKKVCPLAEKIMPVPIVINRSTRAISILARFFIITLSQYS